MSLVVVVSGLVLLNQEAEDVAVPRRVVVARDRGTPVVVVVQADASDRTSDAWINFRNSGMVCFGGVFWWRGRGFLSGFTMIGATSWRPKASKTQNNTETKEAMMRKRGPMTFVFVSLESQRFSGKLCIVPVLLEGRASPDDGHGVIYTVSSSL